MTPFDAAVTSARVHLPEMIEVNADGYPVDVPILTALADAVLAQVGLHLGYGAPIMRDLLRRSNRRTFTRIPEGERVMVCRAADCPSMAEVTTDIGVLCWTHMDWLPPEPECICPPDGVHEGHKPGCPLWAPTDVETWLGEQV